MAYALQWLLHTHTHSWRGVESPPAGCVGLVCVPRAELCVCVRAHTLTTQAPARRADGAYKHGRAVSRRGASGRRVLLLTPLERVIFAKRAFQALFWARRAGVGGERGAPRRDDAEEVRGGGPPPPSIPAFPHGEGRQAATPIRHSPTPYCTLFFAPGLRPFFFGKQLLPEWPAPLTWWEEGGSPVELLWGEAKHDPGGATDP